MTAHTLKWNCNRLLRFLMNTNVGLNQTWDNSADHTPLTIIKAYALILDCHGAGPTGLSRLFLPPEEYREMEEWIASIPLQTIYHKEEKDETIDNNGQMLHVKQPATLGFLYDGYYWDIQKI